MAWPKGRPRKPKTKQTNVPVEAPWREPESFHVEPEPPILPAEPAPIPQPPPPSPAPAAPQPEFRYLSDPNEIRQALADIIVCRIHQTPIPPHLAMNDNLAFTNMTRVKIIMQVMAQEGASLDQARDYALRSIQ